MITILKGNIISSPKLGVLDIHQNAYLVAKDGRIAGIFDKLPVEYKDIKVEDYGDKLIFQAFSDMHLHAPQFPMLGMGMDLPLMYWLNTYTFKTEANFKDKEVARRVYSKLAYDLVKNGTTRVCMFSSIHKEATLILMEELEKAGISGYVGKVNMDQNSPDYLVETTAGSIKETISWINESNFKHIKPIITPRFTPSCTESLLEELGNIAKKNDLPIQSHLSENFAEIELVKKLIPDCTYYYQTYKKHHLWNNKTLMAHCVHSNKKELDSIKKHGIYVVHCAASNQNILSGFAPVRKMLDEGIKVVLGSDIAGGDHLSMFDNVADTIKSSKAKDMIDNYKTAFLTVEEAYYLATSASASFFNEEPGLAIGNILNVLVLDDSKLPSVRLLTIKERFERSMYNRQEDAIVAVYNEKRIY